MCNSHKLAKVAIVCMDPENSTTTDIKSAILADTQSFLAGMASGASHEQLSAILARIRSRELQLIKEEGVMLAPVLWRIMENRLTNRKPPEIIGPFD